MIALLDANILYPPGLRDLLMWLAVVRAYKPRWTDAIHAEWMHNALKDRSEITQEQLTDQLHPRCFVKKEDAEQKTLNTEQGQTGSLARAVETAGRTPTSLWPVARQFSEAAIPVAAFTEQP